MRINKKNNSFDVDTKTNSLSSTAKEKEKKLTKKEIEDTNKKVYDALNQLELKKAIDAYLKENKLTKQASLRDLELLKSIICEYLDSFILFGYNIDGERVIIQNYIKSKDRDAIMEFLKIIFIKQQQDSFLDE